ncbi:molybdopterin oxidoreductase [Bryobacterales bacterium F-183]|nr:molybdopterin oxidoreductase [Bryobacterales bacterium F-183]
MMTRRKWAAAAVGGVAGWTAVTKGKDLGLVPAGLTGGLYAAGEVLTHATQKLLTKHGNAREFTRDQISPKPFATTHPPKNEDYVRMQQAGFADWRLKVDGLVEKPGVELSLADLHAAKASSQITQLVCEEGWSYIAEWKGVPLGDVLRQLQPKPEAKYVAFLTIQDGWWDSIDMDEANHPQTLIAYEMNGAPIPPQHGGPMRLRVPRQLGYKSLKFINRMIVTDDIRAVQNGRGSGAVGAGYSWYAGI